MIPISDKTAFRFSSSDDIVVCKMWNYAKRCRPVESRSGGPGNHYCGALSQLHSVCAEIETPKASRGRKHGEGCPLTIRMGVWRSAVSSPGGVRGGAPAENGFYAFEVRKKPSGTPFQYFWAMAGPPKVAGPGETFPLPLPRRAWSDANIWKQPF